MMALRFGGLWLLAAAALMPLHGVLPAVGSGLVAALVGAAILYAKRGKPDGGVTPAAIGVLVLCALIWAGSITG